ncbi:MAG: S24/S26 family peptidase [Muribaculaceae bacterium]|nr:S24/S26 family peptidase [Muribaculaceae bacterium]
MTETRSIDNKILIGETCLHLSQGRTVKLRAKGNSMRPFIHGNKDILVLSPVNSLRKGDIALARIDGKRYVIHRVIDIKDDIVTLMGDGNLYQTEECFRSDIYGIVEKAIRGKKERNLKSTCYHIMALAWRTMLPIRRIKAKL